MKSEHRLNNNEVSHIEEEKLDLKIKTSKL
jgi:hypothetical protein